MEASAEEWGRKDATLSDKTARSQYGLSKLNVQRDRPTHLLNPGRARGSI